MKIFLAPILLLFAAWASAQGGITVVFESPGKHSVWSAPDLTALDTKAKVTEEGQTAVEGILSDYVVVWNQVTGNVAYRKTRDIKGTWKIDSKEYTLLARLRVSVQHEGKAVKTASVRVNNSTPQVLDESAGGLAQFELVKAGDVKVEVNFRSNNRTRIQRQSFEVPLSHDQAEPNVTVALSHPTETIELVAPAETPKQAPAPKPKASGPSVVGSIGMFLVLVAAAVGVLLLGLRWIRLNEEKAKTVLTNIGVQVPDPIDPTAPDPAIASPDPVAVVPDPEPAPQIILGADAAVAPTPVAQVVPVVAYAPGAPRLVSAAGLPFEIPEGETPVGREAGPGLALVGESTVSRLHAKLVRKGTTVILQDLNSTNGTFVNGLRVSAQQILKVGDEVQFGAVRYRFE